MNSFGAQLMCDPDDPNKEYIAQRVVALQEALALDAVVAISCEHKETKEPAIVLAVMTKSGDGSISQYTPIGTLYYPTDESFMELQPPKGATVLEAKQEDEEDVETR